MLSINSMKIKVFYTIVVITLLLVPCINASAEGNDLSEFEAAFLSMINEARENPLATAESMGMDPDEILLDFPEMEEILTGGLPPLAFNKNLHEAARMHTEDMLEEGYYAHDSPDGLTYEDRIRDAGYIPVAMGESLGLSGFSNFIDPAESVGTIFERMFRDQLDPAGNEQMNILDPEFTQAGISLGTGALNLGGYIFNVYIVTCDFGRSVEKEEMEFFQLINQARSRPLDIAASLGIDPEQLLADFPELHDIATGVLPPLGFNLQLYTAAGAHANDMMNTGYFSHDSHDGRTYNDRIVEAGYDPELTGECLGMQYYHTDTASSGNEAQGMFYDILANELGEENPLTASNILNPDFKEVGVSIVGGISKGLSTICGNQVFFLVADFGTPTEDPPPGIAGVVYEDRDGDFMYDQAEGLSAVPVSICGETVSTVVYTNEAGGFSKVLPCGEYRVSFEGEGTTVIEDWVEITEKSESLFMRVPPAQEHEFN